METGQYLMLVLSPYRPVMSIGKQMVSGLSKRYAIKVVYKLCLNFVQMVGTKPVTT